MGVRGLTTFVENNQRRLLEKDKLHNCSVVIDGFGLLFHLYFGGNLDSRHGGEFAAFAGIIDRFFNQLSSCHIKPYVIFDGPIEPDKLPCVLSRLQDRIRDVSDLVKYEENSRSRIMPLFAVDTLIHYLSTHQIPFAVSLVEADSEIVTVANAMDCPVLSEDSDYYIYNVKNGYIQFQNFNWDRLWWDKGRKSIVCHKYKVSSMRREYGVSETMLPYLSILLGNDWLSRDIFAQLVSRLPQKRGRNYSRIDTVLWWLSTKTNENSLLEKLRDSLSRSTRAEIMGKVTTCLDVYRNECDATATMEILRGNITSKRLDTRSEIEHLVRTSSTHPIAINILDSKYACMPVIMSDPRRPSPHVCATEIRTLFYRVLLRNYRFKTAGPEFLFLQEYDKVEQMYKKSKTVSIMTSLCPMCDTHHELGEECNTASGGDVKSVTMLLKLLQLDNTHSFSKFLEKNGSLVVSQTCLKILDVTMVATLFWYRRTTPKPTCIGSLLVMIAWSIWKGRSRDISVRETESRSSEKLDEMSTEMVRVVGEHKSKSHSMGSQAVSVDQSKPKDRNNSHSKDIDSIKNMNSTKSSIGSEKSQESSSSEDPDSIVAILDKLLNKVVNSCEENPDSPKKVHDEHMELQDSAKGNTSEKLLNLDSSIKGNPQKRQFIDSCKNPNSPTNVQDQPMDLQSITEDGVKNTVESSSKVKPDSSPKLGKGMTGLQKASDFSPFSGDSPIELRSLVSPKQKILKLAETESEEYLDSKSHEDKDLKSQNDVTKIGKKVKVSDKEDRNAQSRELREDTAQNKTGSSKPSTSRKTFTKQVKKPKSVTVEEFLTHFGSMTTKTAAGKTEHIRREFNVELLHSISEWLCILNAALLLHHMVEGQRSDFAMQDFLTSNILLHEIHARIERLIKTSENMQNDVRSISTLILGRLESLPEVQSSFKDFINFLLQHQ